MSSDEIAIKVVNVSKRYEIYTQPRDRLKQFLLPVLRRRLGLKPRDYFTEFWALEDVSFIARKGHAYGIVGMNGSGKSTLLQIITGTLAPTHGSVQINGRVAALLELGSGFDPNFTGEENVFMYGSLLGFTREEIQAKIQAIREFAEVGDHYFRPLHTCSSGMQMRLAFAVSTAFDPDILIVDEALAVGDAYFQQKCFRLLEDFRARGGTLLFVSHDANAVKTLCDGAVLLDRGRKLSDGAPRQVIDLYQGLIMQRADLGDTRPEIIQADTDDSPIDTAVNLKATTTTGNGDASLLSFDLLDEQGRKVAHIESEAQLTVRYVVRVKKAFDRPAFGVIVRDRIGRSIYETTTYAQLGDISPIEMDQKVEVRFDFAFNLRAGVYSFSVGISNRGYARSEFEEISLLMHDVAQVEVSENADAKFYGGLFNMRPSVTVSSGL
ncbi:MAG: ABC transporter ATP-binding protein [Xylophilus ampelinus]